MTYDEMVKLKPGDKIQLIRSDAGLSSDKVFQVEFFENGLINLSCADNKTNGFYLYPTVCFHNIKKVAA